MNILFINPNYADIRSHDVMEPLVFAILSGCTPSKHTVTLFDERLEQIEYNFPADLVAISVLTFTAKRAYTIAGKFRQRGIKVVMGGFHPTLMPDEVIEFCDAVVIGDAEPVWEKLLEDADNGQLQKFYHSSNEYDLSKTIYDRSIFLDKKYSFVKPVQFGRGCRFSCDFCSVHAFYGSGIRQMSIDSMIKQIQRINSSYLLFVDDNLLGNYDHVMVFLKAMIPLHKKWICQISIDAADKPELLNALQESGCIAVFIGFESLQKESLVQIGKSGNMVCTSYSEAIKVFRDHKIMVCGSFVFGYEGDTEESVEQACTFAIEQKLCIAHFNLLFPTPGTRLYKRLQDTNRLRFYKWWLEEEYRYGDCTFYPPSIGHRHLAEKCMSVRKRFDSLKSILSRSIDMKANAGSIESIVLFLTANLLSRKEITAKAGRRLG
jgi:radical SAM superfamily enzyme YgiQ (UPF0313 family)